MPIVTHLYLEGGTRENYDAVRKLTQWGDQQPEGGLFHCASFDDKGLFVTVIWENREYWEKFRNSVLMPAIKQVGIKAEPNVRVTELYALFTPAFKPIRNIPTPGSTSVRMQ